MVLFTRRTTPKPGKYLDAIKWAKEVADYLNNKFEIGLSVYSQRYGENPLGTIFWVASFESMSAFEELGNKLSQDEGYGSLVAPGAELTAEGTTFDSFLDKH